MHVALRTGLELPAVPLGGGERPGGDDALVAALHRAAGVTAALGFSTLWFGDAPAAGAGGRQAWTEAGVLAAATASAAGPMHVGLVAGDGGGMQPSAVARQVTTLDQVSGGRAALRLEFARAPLEAAQVCRGLFTQDVTTVHGAVYRTAGAVNRPPPVQSGGPPLVVSLAPEEIGPGLSDVVDAVCVGGGPEEVARARARFGGDGVVWTGMLPADRDEASRVVGALHDAGAGGIIARVPGLDTLVEVTEAWAAALEPYRS